MKKLLGFLMEPRHASRNFPDMSRNTRGCQCYERLFLTFCFVVLWFNLAFSVANSSFIVRANIISAVSFTFTQAFITVCTQDSTFDEQKEVSQQSSNRKQCTSAVGGPSFFTVIEAIIFFGPPLFFIVFSLAIV
jgi:hypothetical protein